MILIRKKELVNVQVLYYIPDYDSLLNEFFFQFEDYVPDIPRVHKFLNFWKENIEAVIKEVRICSSNNAFINSKFYERII